MKEKRKNVIAVNNINFFSLVEYCENDKLKKILDKHNSIEYLREVLDSDFKNNNTYDLINYERLIMIEVLYRDNPEIQDLIE